MLCYDEKLDRDVDGCKREREREPLGIILFSSLDSAMYILVY